MDANEQVHNNDIIITALICNESKSFAWDFQLFSSRIVRA